MDEVIDMLNLLNSEDVTDAADLQMVIDEAKKSYAWKRQVEAVTASYQLLVLRAREVFEAASRVRRTVELYECDLDAMRELLDAHDADS